MKKHTFSLLAIATVVLCSSFIFLREAAAPVYKVDSAKSTLKWTGKKVTGEHTGTIKISTGTLTVDKNVITAGSFDIDLTTITSTDITDPSTNAKLIGHLKADDFFSVAKFPKATFVITSVKSKGKDLYDVTGNLTIKGITNPVAFPATIKAEAGKVTATATILVDRTKYDIKFRSASFFSDLGDKAIDNDFALDLNLVATK